MCELSSVLEVSQKPFIGYKVALQHKRSKKYYSPAMGCEYKVGPVPVVNEQKCLTNYFRDDILSDEFNLFKKNMVGRTAVFESLDVAEELKYVMGDVAYYGVEEDEDYDVVILKMTISGKLMRGYYTIGLVKSDVVAGRHIDKIEKLKK